MRNCRLFLLVAVVASVAGKEQTLRGLMEACVFDGTCAILNSSCVLHNPVLLDGRKPLWYLALSEEAFSIDKTEGMSPTESPRRLLKADEVSRSMETEQYLTEFASNGQGLEHRVRRSASPKEIQTERLSDEELKRASRSLGKQYIPAELPPQALVYRVPSRNAGYHEKYPPAVRAAAKAARTGAVKKIPRQTPRLQFIPDYPQVPATGQAAWAPNFEDGDPGFKDFIYYDDNGGFTIEHYRYNATCFPMACNGVEFYPHPKYCDRYYLCNPDLNIAHYEFCPRYKKFDYKLSLCVGIEEIPKMFCDPYIDCSGFKSKN